MEYSNSITICITKYSFIFKKLNLTKKKRIEITTILSVYTNSTINCTSIFWYNV